MMMLGANNYADHYYSEKEKKEANKNPEENKAVIISLLKNGEYTECDSFIASHDITPARQKKQFFMDCDKMNDELIQFVMTRH